jgi:hypothetical protein
MFAVEPDGAAAFPLKGTAGTTGIEPDGLIVDIAAAPLDSAVEGLFVVVPAQIENSASSPVAAAALHIRSAADGQYIFFSQDCTHYKFICRDAPVGRLYESGKINIEGPVS